VDRPRVFIGPLAPKSSLNTTPLACIRGGPVPARIVVGGTEASAAIAAIRGPSKQALRAGQFAGFLGASPSIQAR
jgi:hypothetical protein